MKTVTLLQSEWTELMERAAETEKLRAEIAELRADIDERTAEQQLFDKDLGEKQRLIDRIADLIGLPKDEELDQVTFELWFSGIEKLRADLASIRSVYDFAALEAKIAELRAENHDLRSSIITDLGPKLADLRVALKPFADEAESMIKNEEGWPEDKPIYSDGKVTIADYRRAAQASEQRVRENKS